MTRDSITYAPLPFRDEQGKFLPGSPYAGQRKLLEATMRRAVMQDNAQRLRLACERILTDAAESDNWQHRLAAFTIIADRLDGKAVARIETSDGDARSLSLAEIVHAVLQARASSASDAEHAPASDPTQAQIGTEQEQEQEQEQR